MSILTDLAEVINLIRPFSGFAGYEFNPLPLIKAVNFCYSLGYDKSLQILQLYCYLIERIEEQLPEILSNIDVNIADICTEPKKIFLIARLLFVCKDRQIILPRIGFGQPDLEPQEPSLFPCFPLNLYQDLPFCLLIRGYTLFGVPQSPNMYLDWCAKECQLRETPLLPSNHPLDSVDEFLSSEVWRNLIFVGVVEGALPFLEATFCRMLRLQALRTVSNVYSISEQDEIKFIKGYSNSTDEEINEIWHHHKQAFTRLNIFWNPFRNEYDTSKTID